MQATQTHDTSASRVPEQAYPDNARFLRTMLWFATLGLMERMTRGLARRLRRFERHRDAGSVPEEPPDHGVSGRVRRLPPRRRMR